MAENDNPSLETKQAIADGVNWLANWYKERCEAGIISSEEYALAIDKLKNVKIYTTKQGVNRLTEELEKGNVHFLPEMERKGATVEGWKAFMKKNNVFPKGWCARDNIKEPAIVLDIDAINKKSNNNPKEITATVIHELTHLTANTFNSEKDVKDAMNGINLDDKAKSKKQFNLEYNDAVETVKITPTIVADTNTPLVVPPTNNAKKLIEGDTNETRVFLKDGVMFNPYLDGENEVYARIMELRYNLGLKGNETIKEEQLNGVEFEDVLNRYKTSMVKTILNDVADRGDTKKQMECQSLVAQHAMSKLQDKYATDDTPQKQTAKEDKVQNNQVALSKMNDNCYS